MSKRFIPIRNNKEKTVKAEVAGSSWVIRGLLIAWLIILVLLLGPVGG